MIDREFEFLRKKLERIVYYAFIDIRNLSLMGAMKQIHDLADTAELIPEYLARRAEFDLCAIRGGLQEYAEKYGGMANRLLDILNADESTFDDSYGLAYSENLETTTN